MDVSGMDGDALVKCVEAVSPIIVYGVFPRFRLVLLILFVYYAWRQNRTAVDTKIDRFDANIQKMHILGVGMRIVTLVLLWNHSTNYATNLWSRVSYGIIDVMVGSWIMSQGSIRSTLSILPFDRIAQNVIEKWTRITITDQTPTTLDVITAHYNIITEYLTNIATYSVKNWFKYPRPFFTCIYWAICAWYIPGFIWTFSMLTLITAGAAYAITFAKSVLNNNNNNSQDIDNEVSWAKYVYSSIAAIWNSGLIGKSVNVVPPDTVSGFSEDRFLRSFSEIGHTGSTLKDKPTPAETMAMLDNILSSTLTDMFTKTKSA